jgi:hypothetical protein
MKTDAACERAKTKLFFFFGEFVMDDFGSNIPQQQRREGYSMFEKRLAKGPHGTRRNESVHQSSLT